MGKEKTNQPEKSIFAKIRDGEVESEILYQDEHFFVINDIRPQAPVHVLVITKEQYPTLESLEQDNDQLHAGLLQVARKMAHKLEIADNYKIVINVGQQLQEVYHIHLHLLGGWNKKDATRAGQV